MNDDRQRGVCKPVRSACLGLGMFGLCLLGTVARAGTVELMVDRHFDRGLAAYAPDTVPQVVTGWLQWDDTQPAPVWTLAQWGTDFDLSGTVPTLLPSGASLFQVTAKHAVLGPRGTMDADLVLGLDAWPEYEGEWREAGEEWPALLAGQRVSYPKHLGPGCPWLHELTELRFQVEARLLEAERYDVPGYNPSLHTAHFLIHFTIQNLNQSSPRYGDYLFLGCALYDERWEMPGAHMAPDSGTGKYIYTPATEVYASESMHGGAWVSFSADLLPLAMAALQKAWDEGFLSGSQDPGDYRIGGTTAGWEVPGLSKATVQMRNFSITATGPLVGQVRDWGDADAWPHRAVPATDGLAVLFDDRKVTGQETCAGIRGPGWEGRSCTLTIHEGGSLTVNGSCLMGVGEGVTGTIRLEGGRYASDGDIQVGRPYGDIPTGHGILSIGPGSTLEMPEAQVWVGAIDGQGTLVVEGGGGAIGLGNLRFDGEAGIGMQRFEIRPAANGAEGLTVVQAGNLVWPDHATLIVEPGYCPDVGDSWEIVRWTGSRIAGNSGTAEFAAVETPEGIQVELDYGTSAQKRVLVTVTASECPGETDLFHDADVDENGQIALGEMLRVVQLHGAGAYHCAPEAGDGFGPGAGDVSCARHDADFLGPAWRITLSEALRVIQIYQMGAYDPCETGEDGFCARVLTER